MIPADYLDRLDAPAKNSPVGSRCERAIEAMPGSVLAFPVLL
jgi:hypothetical protein